MIDTLAFYNYGNAGDLHCSRQLVKYLLDHVPARRYVYAHQRSHRILQDLRLEQVPITAAYSNRLGYIHDATSGLLALNTWYAVSPTFHETRCSLNCLVDLFHHQIQRHELDLVLPPIEDLIPTIDFGKFHTEPARQYMNEVSPAYKRRVLVANGETLSGQTRGSLADFIAVVTDVAARHPETLFLLSNRAGSERALALPNVACTRDVIGLPEGECDLPENAFLSTQCDVLIGRGSGAYTFSYLAENFMDPDKTMICFTDEERTARWVYPPETVKARVIWSNGYSQENIRVLMEAILS